MSDTSSTTQLYRWTIFTTELLLNQSLLAQAKANQHLAEKWDHFANPASDNQQTENDNQKENPETDHPPWGHC